MEKAIEAQQRKLRGPGRIAIDKTLDEEKAEFEARLATLREQQAKAHESQRHASMPASTS